MQMLGGRLADQAQTTLALNVAGLWPSVEKKMVSVALAPDVVVEDGRQQQAEHYQPQLPESAAAAAKLLEMALAEWSAHTLRSQVPAWNKSFLLAESHSLRSCFELSIRIEHESVDLSRVAATVPAEASRHRLPGYPWQDVKRSSEYFPRRPQFGSTYRSTYAAVATGPSHHRIRELLFTCKIQRGDTLFK